MVVVIEILSIKADHGFEYRKSIVAPDVHWANYYLTKPQMQNIKPSWKTELAENNSYY